ncbi:hypothetical protein Q31b_38710 [Novipirellula aureliae]|uniref:Secreted protein n=1 Tax=Novipirellula aureliae TaxID=2527966 RepID=A0A5C6DND2_9BACT|nr:hypothetical protein [Novipirellula aureliae]TWU38793.1 hypothetical protein Q31b_38710 [Novipirellula aureliae]
MKSISAVLLAMLFFTAAGCGGGNDPAPSPDEITNFLEENPDVVEATNRANAAESFDGEGF